MNVRVFALAWLLALALAGGARADDDLRLLWSNGDSLPGGIDSLEGDSLRWKSPLFEGHVVVGIPSLRAISFPAVLGLVEVDEPFRVDTGSGDILYGKLTAVDEKTVTLESDRHGALVLKRGEIVSLRRLTNSAFLALDRLAGWKTLDPDRDISAWRTGIRGRIEAGERNAELFRKVELPARAEIELALSWEKEPGFIFSVTRNDEVRDPESVTIETWDDEVVVVKGGDFEPVKRLSKTAGRLHLRLYIDRDKREITVCSYEGRPLAKISGGVAGSGENLGIYLRNKRKDLALETLRIGRWNGLLPKPVSPGANRLHLIDGEVVSGVVKAFDAGSKSFLVEHDGEQKPVPLDQLDTLYFSANPRPAAENVTEVSFHDGAVLRGQLESLSADQGRLRTPFADLPVSCKLERCREISWSPKDQPAPAGGDVLYWEEGRSHGAVEPVTGEGFPIGWKPIGSGAAVALEESGAIRILRRDVKLEGAIDNRFPDAVYLTDFTALPCRVSEIGAAGAMVVTPFNRDPVAIKNDLMKAVEFARPEGMAGFSDPRWKITGKEDSVKLDAHEASFAGAGRLSHPSALNGSEVRFKLGWDKQSRIALQLRLFAKSAGDGFVSPIDYALNCSATSMSIRGRNGRYLRATAVRSPSAEFVLIRSRDRLIIKVNGQEVVQENLDALPGRGFEFGVTSLTDIRGKPGGGPVRISDFSSRMAGGDTSLYIPEEVKDKVLTVPRLRKSNPPKHIVASPNGDVLRGELVSLDAEKASFRSKLRDLQIPRARVAGIIWFHDDKAVSARSGSIRVVLPGDRIVAVDPEEMDGNALTGRSGVFGEVRIPLGQIREFHLGDYVPAEAFAPYADWSLRAAREPFQKSVEE